MFDLKLLWDRARYILVQPVKAWERIRSENRSLKDVHKSFLVPVLVLLSVSAFAGTLIYSPAGLSIIFPFIKGIKQFVCFYATVLFTAWVINELSLAFVQKKDYNLNFKLVAYSLTPLYLTVFITRFLPDLGILNILALYGSYILFTGLKTIENISRQGIIRYFIVALLTIVVFYLSISWITRSLLEGVYFAVAGSV